MRYVVLDTEYDLFRTSYIGLSRVLYELAFNVTLFGMWLTVVMSSKSYEVIAWFKIPRIRLHPSINLLNYSNSKIIWMNICYTLGSVQNRIFVRNRSVTKISHNFVCPLLIHQLSYRFDILHSARQCYYRANLLHVSHTLLRPCLINVTPAYKPVNTYHRMNVIGDLCSHELMK